MAQTVHHLVGVGEFTVHIPKENVIIDADREEWLNNSLP